MREYGYRGVLYLLGDFSVRHNQWDLAADPTEPRAAIMDEAQKCEFVAAGWEIGAHTMSHPRLTTLPLPDAAAEIQRSKASLEAALQTEVVSFAYPYGDLNEGLKGAVRAAGFAFGVATDTGGLHLEDDRMQVFRINMFPHETSSSLFKKTSVWYRKYYRWKRGKWRGLGRPGRCPIVGRTERNRGLPSSRYRLASTCVISSSLSPANCTFLNAAVWPASSVTLLLGMPKASASSRCSAALAWPSWAGAARRAVTVPSGATSNWLARQLGLALRCRIAICPAKMRYSARPRRAWPNGHSASTTQRAQAGA